MAVMTYIDAINSALREEMERDPSVFVIGEDIGRMGGAFRATQGLLQKFGSERVIDSPLAEGVIISSSIGAAMVGMRPVPEIQFLSISSRRRWTRSPNRRRNFATAVPARRHVH